VTKTTAETHKRGSMLKPHIMEKNRREEIFTFFVVDC